MQTVTNNNEIKVNKLNTAFQKSSETEYIQNLQTMDMLKIKEWTQKNVAE